MAERVWQVYLSGEIHSDWRERIEAGVGEAGLPVALSAPVTDHAASDDAGVGTLGEARPSPSGAITWAPASTRSAPRR